MSALGPFEKRLLQLAQTVGTSRARTIAIRVPTLLSPTDGSVESTATVEPETQLAVDEILQELGVADDDLVIEVRHFYTADSESIYTSPELLSVR